MVHPAAEESYRQGLRSLQLGKGLQALAYFEAAIQIDRQHLTDEPGQARYLSFYGLCLAIEARKPMEGIKFCKEAVALEPFHGDLYHNLCRAFLAANRKKEAVKALVDGQRVEPDHPGLRQQWKQMGERKPPVLTFLDRSNPINVALGKMRGSGER